MSSDWPVQIGSAHFEVPGFMMWVAFVYAAIASWITHRVGRPLVPINFDRLRFEADFRFGLVRFRENAEAIGLAGGESFEEKSAVERFRRIVGNWWELIRAQRNLTLLTTGIGQLNGAVPLLVAAPGYFLGNLTLGRVAQAGIAYGQVSGALAWFVNAYQEIALWRASIERLLTFTDALDAGAHPAHGVQPVRGAGRPRRAAGRGSSARAARRPRAARGRKRIGGAGRAGGRGGADGRRSDHAVPRARGSLAIRPRPHRDAPARADDVPVAAAVPADRARCAPRCRIPRPRPRSPTRRSAKR